MSEHKHESRRRVLKFGLASVAGFAAGHSILKNDAAAQVQVTAKPVTLSIPKLALTGTGANRALTPSSKSQLLDAIVPVLAQIIVATGDRLDEAQISQMKSALLSSGQIQLPTAGVGVSLIITSANFSPVRNIAR